MALFRDLPREGGAAAAGVPARDVPPPPSGRGAGPGTEDASANGRLFPSAPPLARANRRRARPAMEAALQAMTQGKARMRRRTIRARAHDYERTLLRPWFSLPESWFQAHALADPFIARAIVRRLKGALIRDRRLRGNFLRRPPCPLDRETMLWSFLGGELLNLGRHVNRPEDIL